MRKEPANTRERVVADTGEANRGEATSGPRCRGGRAEKVRLWRWPNDDRFGSGDLNASAQSVGRPSDSIAGDECGASAASDAVGAIFALTLSALGRITPRSRYGTAASVADRIVAIDNSQPDQRPATDSVSRTSDQRLTSVSRTSDERLTSVSRTSDERLTSVSRTSDERLTSVSRTSDERLTSVSRTSD